MFCKSVSSFSIDKPFPDVLGVTSGSVFEALLGTTKIEAEADEASDFVDDTFLATVSIVWASITLAVAWLVFKITGHYTSHQFGS